jgi:hypothetical protein
MCAGWAHSGDGNDGRLGGAFPDTIVMRGFGDAADEGA